MELCLPGVEKKEVAVDASHIGTITEPECLGPCEPGTSVTLEGIVWNETENGVSSSLLGILVCPKIIFT